MIIIAIMTVVCKCCNEKRANRDAIIYDDYSVCAPYITFYENNNGKKKENLLRECDVFTLRIKSPQDIHYGFVEWGRAKELGKILVVIYDFTYLLEDWEMLHPNLFKYLMKESKQSFKTLSKEMKNEVIKRHPNFSVTDFKEYKNYLASYLSQ